MSMDYGRVLCWTRTRLLMGIITATGMSVRGTKRRFTSGESLIGFE